MHQVAFKEVEWTAPARLNASAKLSHSPVLCVFHLIALLTVFIRVHGRAKGSQRKICDHYFGLSSLPSQVSLLRPVAGLLVTFVFLSDSVDCNPRGIDWGQWWTYDGISGPRFWGVINPAWGMCKDGRRQSPINIDPRTLLFDPNLSPFTLDKVNVAGELINTGHSVEWHMRPHEPTDKFQTNQSASRLTDGQILSSGSRDDLSSKDFDWKSSHQNYSITSTSGSRSKGIRNRGSAQNNLLANISGGPLSYTYSLTHTRLHFGDQNEQGSEHLLDNRAFPAELQIYGYNSQLYNNFTEASGKVYGVAAIAVFVQIGDSVSSELETMLEGIKSIKYGGSSKTTALLRLDRLIPSTQQYMTYEGSMTEPACHETITWILPNKPAYITREKMEELRGLRQSSSPPLTHAALSNNFRPVQTAHHRTVRANINTKYLNSETRCHIADPRLVYRGEWRSSKL
ncbi:Alpha carbonic anhydrase [Trinorchestia longiramus]|nr:Alpha carbonic anhydrase [Trinorchestia longiramus]